MPNYLKSHTIQKIGFESHASFTTFGTSSIEAEGIIDCSNMSRQVIRVDVNNASVPINIYLTNYIAGAVINLCLVNRGTSNVNVHPPSGASINGLPIDDTIDINFGGSGPDSKIVFVYDSLNAYSTN